MSKQDSASDLYDLKNYFFLGNYQGAINEGSTLTSLQDNDKIERDIYVYRSYIAQKKYQFVLDDIRNNAPAPLQAIKLLANFLAKSDSTKDKDAALTSLKEMLSNGSSANNNPTLQLVAAIIYYHEANYEEAMRAVYQSNNLEGLAMLIHIYLKINRLDQAEKELKAMQKIDDDATITQLAGAWVNLSAGGERINDALTTFSEMIEKFNATSLLLNGIGICNMHLRRFPEAERSLLQALEKESSNADTIANLIAVSEQQSKPAEIIQRQINQLKITAPKHPFLNQYQKVEEEFDRVSKSFSFSN